MLQQRFFDNIYFFACGFYFLIKFFLFFVQFSVHFLFFTCFFFITKKILHLFHFLLLLTLSRTWFCLFLFHFFFWQKAPALWQLGANQRKRGRCTVGPKPKLSRQKTGRWGFVGLRVCFCMDVWFLFCFECMLFFFTSLYTYVTFL